MIFWWWKTLLNDFVSGTTESHEKSICLSGYPVLLFPLFLRSKCFFISMYDVSWKLYCISVWIVLDSDSDRFWIFRSWFQHLIGILWYRVCWFWFIFTFSLCIFFRQYKIDILFIETFICLKLSLSNLIIAFFISSSC